MLRGFAWVLVTFLILPLAGCGNSEPETTDPIPDIPPGQTTDAPAEGETPPAADFPRGRAPMPPN